MSPSVSSSSSKSRVTLSTGTGAGTPHSSSSWILAATAQEAAFGCTGSSTTSLTYLVVNGSTVRSIVVAVLSVTTSTSVHSSPFSLIWSVHPLVLKSVLSAIPALTSTHRSIVYFAPRSRVSVLPFPSRHHFVEVLPSTALPGSSFGLWPSAEASAFSATFLGSTFTTVNSQTSLSCPSSVVTVTCADPSARAVTRPLSSTDTTSGSEDSHVTFWLDALDGVICASSCSVPPISISTESLFSCTDSTDTGVTVTLHTAVTLPS